MWLNKMKTHKNGNERSKCENYLMVHMFKCSKWPHNSIINGGNDESVIDLLPGKKMVFLFVHSRESDFQEVKIECPNSLIQKSTISIVTHFF